MELCNFLTYLIIYVKITKNIRYLLWNRGVWRFFHDIYLTIEVQGIRCTNHLLPSCPLTDVNPHFTAPGCRYYFKINSWWPIVTSSTHGRAASYCDVTMAHCSHGYLWTHDGTLGDQMFGLIYTCFWVNLFVYFTYHSRTPVFQHRASLVHVITKNIRYLLWNRGAWHFFNDTHLTIEVRGIRCTNHLHDFCPLTDVNPHFTAPGCRYYLKINSWWPIVTSSTLRPAASYCDVTMAHCSHGYLWTHDITAWDKFISLLGLTTLFTFLLIFGTPCFNTGHR